MKMIDVVIELVDARIPKSSTNPMIGNLIGQKPAIIVLNKADLADPEEVKQWLQYYRSEGRIAIPLNSKESKSIKRLIQEIRSLAEPKLAHWRSRGLKNRSVRTMILGIPNVGKSTLMNRLAGRNAAKTADKPGETKGKQWVHLGDQLDLLDTPGVLWPKLEDQVSAYRLAATGAISDTVFDMETVVFSLIEEVRLHYPQALQARFSLTDLSTSREDIISTIGRKRGCLKKGNELDWEKHIKLF